MSTSHVAAQAPAPTEGLTPERLHAVLAGICAQAGLDPRDAHLIKFTNNAVFRLASAPVVVRIAGSRAVSERIDTVIATAQWFAQHEVPAVRLLEEVAQPVVADGYAATLWHLVPDSGPQATGAGLGQILSQIHQLPTPEFALPQWSPFTQVRTRISDAEALADNDRDWLLERCAQVEEQLHTLDYVLAPGVIHGDPFLGNLIPGPHGPVICDLDSVCWGPREWDLAPVAVGKLRMDYDYDAHTPLVQEYGFDVTTWPGFDVLRQVRELKLVTSVLPILRSQPTIRPQWEHRFASLRAGDASVRWQTYR
ncbi:phosphotransferase enzyme family protein [Nocardiopsis synnemataformans]|uniref:phosphotransferase enzyme family protein n=1 Tax=Nocardiopsis synnemataformans TaxID=61305 RepID=UPI003EC126B7